MTCLNPLDWGTLVDYWAGDLDAAASDTVEDHLFGCADCTAAAARVAGVTEALRAALPPVVSRERIERLRARGARIRENDFLPGDRREVVFVRDADLLIHRLSGLDLTHADRVDFRIAAESTGELLASVEGVPFDPNEGAVLVACQRHYATMPADTVISLAIHTPSRPAQDRDLHDPAPVRVSAAPGSGLRLGTLVARRWRGGAGARCSSASPTRCESRCTAEDTRRLPRRTASPRRARGSRIALTSIEA